MFVLQMRKLGVWMVRLLPKELEVAFDEILEEIQNSADYQEYLELEEKMKQNKTIQDLILSIKCLQKELVRLEYNKDDLTDVALKYQEALAHLNDFPLYVVFVEKQKRVNEMLQNVKSQIEDFFDQIVQNKS